MRQNKENTQFKADEVMEYIQSRIDTLAKQIRGMGLSEEFGNVSSLSVKTGSDGSGFGLMGSLIFDTFLFGSILEAIDTGFLDAGVTSESFTSAKFNNAAMVVMEAVSVLDDDNKVHAIRYNGSRVYYPKGRSKSKMAIDPKLAARFNRTANQNYASPAHIEAELSALIEVMRKLENLTQMKVHDLTVQKGESIASTIHKMHRDVQKHGALDLMVGGLRRAI